MGKIMYACDKCGLVFTSKRNKQFHDLNNRCLKSSGNLSNLKNGNTCKKCGLLFNREETFQHHLKYSICGRKEQEKPGNPVICLICGNEYVDQMHLRRHQKRDLCIKAPGAHPDFPKLRSNDDDGKQIEGYKRIQVLNQPVIYRPRYYYHKTQSPTHYMCDICNHVINGTDDFYLHLTRKHQDLCLMDNLNVPDIKCSRCDELVNANKYPLHANTHVCVSGPGRARYKYCCRICGIRISSQFRVHVHFAAHGVYPKSHYPQNYKYFIANGKKKIYFPCSRCRYTTDDQAEIFRHLDKEHNVKMSTDSLVSPGPNKHTKIWQCEKIYKCHHCLESFQSPTLAAVHVGECERVYGIM